MSEEPPKRMSASTAQLLGIAAALMPEGRPAVEPAGHECVFCRQRLGHAATCKADAFEKFTRHVAHHSPCLRVWRGAQNDSGLGLCPRGKRLLDRVKATSDVPASAQNVKVPEVDASEKD